MKPGDHPDFFRLPAPEGRSRESSIRLDAQGRFWHDGVLLTHPGMVRAFARWIDRHPDDGRFILQNGYDWTYFTVEDVPFFVRGVRLIPEGVQLSLSDDTTERLDPDGVVVSDAGVLYARVKQGKFQARFLQQAQAALGPLLVETEDGFGLEVLGAVHPIRRR